MPDGFAGYCRFTVPDGAGPVAVKVMNTLLWGRMDTYNFLTEAALGSDRTVFDGCLRIPWASSRDRQGSSRTRPRATSTGSSHMSMPRQAGSSPGRVAAQVELGHRDEDLLHQRPDGSGSSRSHTSPQVSAWWAFNLDPGRYAVTARVGGRTVDATVAVLQPETFGFIRIPIAWDRSVPLPRCE